MTVGIMPQPCRDLILFVRQNLCGIKVRSERFLKPLAYGGTGRIPGLTARTPVTNRQHDSQPLAGNLHIIIPDALILDACKRPSRGIMQSCERKSGGVLDIVCVTTASAPAISARPQFEIEPG
jgi:hypothetical protein